MGGGVDWPTKNWHQDIINSKSDHVHPPPPPLSLSPHFSKWRSSNFIFDKLKSFVVNFPQCLLHLEKNLFLNWSHRGSGGMRGGGGGGRGGGVVGIILEENIEGKERTKGGRKARRIGIMYGLTDFCRTTWRTGELFGAHLAHPPQKICSIIFAYF